MSRLPAVLPAALLVLLAAVSCTARIETPRGLMDEVIRRQTEKDYGGTWDLVSEEGRRRFAQAVDASRQTLRKNPNNPNIAKQYQVSDQEFLTLPIDAIWRRSLAGTDRVLLGAKVISEAPAPGEFGVVQLDVETAYGQKFRYYVHEDGDRGWRLRNTQPLQLEKPSRPE